MSDPSCNAMVERRRPWRSNDAALREVGDLLLRVADGREDVLVVLPELRGRAPQRKALVTERDRMAENSEVAECPGVDGLGHGQVLDLGIGKRLVDLVNRAAGHAGLVQPLDPLGAGL